MQEYIVTFHTHFGASQFARSLKAAGIRHRMMPVPRALSSSCGTCVRLWCEDTSSLPREEEQEGLYRVEGSSYLPVEV